MLPDIQIHDYRIGGMIGYQHDASDRAGPVLNALTDGLPRSGKLALPLADQAADLHLASTNSAYHGEVRAIGRWSDRPGAMALTLTSEFGCTARAYDGPHPVLFRTFDCPGAGIGARVEIVALPGEAGDWMAVTWPGMVGCMQGMAPGRFSAALNRAPERLNGECKGNWPLGAAIAAGNLGMFPSHLLRQVFETAPDFATARTMLSQTPLAMPAIFTLAGFEPGQVCVIERTEMDWAEAGNPAAANHFATELAMTGQWEPHGAGSEARREQIMAEAAPREHASLTAPILTAETCLAMTASAAGALTVTGFVEGKPVSRAKVRDMPMLELAS